MYFYRKRENRSSRRKPSKHRRHFQICWRDCICSGHLQTRSCQQQLLTSCYLTSCYLHFLHALNLSTQSNFHALNLISIIYYFHALTKMRITRRPQQPSEPTDHNNPPTTKHIGARGGKGEKRLVTHRAQGGQRREKISNTQGARGAKERKD
jgi:hypothetical protein